MKVERGLKFNTDLYLVLKRPIGAGGIATNGMRATIPDQSKQMRPVALLDFENRHRYFNFIAFAEELGNAKTCPEGIPSSQHELHNEGLMKHSLLQDIVL